MKVIADAETLRIEVEDRGRGIVAVTDDDPHFGLRLLRARTEQLGRLHRVRVDARDAAFA